MMLEAHRAPVQLFLADHGDRLDLELHLRARRAGNNYLD